MKIISEEHREFPNQLNSLYICFFFWDKPSRPMTECPSCPVGLVLYQDKTYLLITHICIMSRYSLMFAKGSAGAEMQFS